MMPKVKIIRMCNEMKKKLRFTFIFLVILNTIKVAIVLNGFISHEKHPDIHFGLLEKPNNLVSLI